MKKLLFFLAGILLFTSIQAQQRMMLSADKAVIILELKRVITIEEGDLIVGAFLGGHSNQESSKINIKEGDKITYVNGKKIDSIKSLREAYENVKAGEEVQLGVKRGNERFIVSFERSDKVPPGMMIKRSTDSEDNSKDDNEGQ